MLPGQFIFGREKAAESTGLGEQTIRTCLEYLKSTGRITIKVTSRFSVITLMKWAEYQTPWTESNQQTNQQTNQQVTSSQPASNQQVTTYNQGNKGNKGEAGEDGLTPSVVLSQWNKMAAVAGLPTCMKLSAERVRHVTARIAEPAFRNSVAKIMTLISESDFLAGNNDRGWRITFDWLVKNDGNYVKILEGRYTEDSYRQETDDDPDPYRDTSDPMEGKRKPDERLRAILEQKRKQEAQGQP